MSGTALHIDIVSDVICPWCFIGKRNLETALAGLGSDQEVRIRWHPYQLDPAVPEGGVDRRAYFERKFGSVRAVEKAFSRVEELGAKAGIGFQFGSIGKMINTLGLHALLHEAGREGFQHDLQEIFFRAYFIEGRDLSQLDVVAELLQPWGWDEAKVRTVSTSEESRRSVQERIRQVREQGVDGVPFFIINHLVTFSGAHPPEVFREVIAEALNSGEEFLPGD